MVICYVLAINDFVSRWYCPVSDSEGLVCFRGDLGGNNHMNHQFLPKAERTVMVQDVTLGALTKWIPER